MVKLVLVVIVLLFFCHIEFSVTNENADIIITRNNNELYDYESEVDNIELQTTQKPIVKPPRRLKLKKKNIIINGKLRKTTKRPNNIRKYIPSRKPTNEHGNKKEANSKFDSRYIDDYDGGGDGDGGGSGGDASKGSGNGGNRCSGGDGGGGGSSGDSSGSGVDNNNKELTALIDGNNGNGGNGGKTRSHGGGGNGIRSGGSGTIDANSIECYSCKGCNTIDNSTSVRLCPYGIDAKIDKQCIVYAEKTKDGISVVRGCASEYGTCDAVKKTVSFVACTLCEGETCNNSVDLKPTNGVDQIAASIGLAVITLLSGPMLVKHIV